MPRDNESRIVGIVIAFLHHFDGARAMHIQELRQPDLRSMTLNSTRPILAGPGAFRQVRTYSPPTALAVTPSCGFIHPANTKVGKRLLHDGPRMVSALPEIWLPGFRNR
ncbi:MAG: hypothetical protein M3Y65_06310 [Pseudomonadota bacterium]|nr:hypothetical protein [Pseudomonadota bacterium]